MPTPYTRRKTQAVPCPTDLEGDEEQEEGGIFPKVECVLSPDDRDANNVILQTQSMFRLQTHTVQVGEELPN